jgi:wyosine [tRNA(Phe)-imidazoG37] synthetase (radical SAM superfamily)
MRNTDKKYKYLFGPVPSRRLGRSLGVDIIPHKVCTLNCIYCEVGKTTDCHTDRKRFYNPEEILSEFKENYADIKEELDVVTITGAGEPTLSSDFGYILREIKKICEHPVAVLTNSTLLTDESVQEELLAADIVVPSIDAATQDAYKKICAPHRSITVNEVNEAVVEFSGKFSGRLLIEILLCDGINDNLGEIGKIADIIKRCRYEMVQLNTVHRPPAFSRAKTVSENFLIDAAIYLKQQGINVEPVGNFIKGLSAGSVTTGEVERLLTMRPCSIDDMAKVFGVSEEELLPKLKEIGDENLEKREHQGEMFFFKR